MSDINGGGASNGPSSSPGHLGDVPAGVIDLGGREAELPVVRRLLEALETDKPIRIVGGGGSGKTEYLRTALHLARAPYARFDLRAWTLAKLSDRRCLADLLCELRDEDASIAQILRHFHAKNLSNHELRRLYLRDASFAIKHAERFLVQRFEREVRAVLAAPAIRVAVLDEFDMGIGSALHEVEIATVRVLLGIVSPLVDRQIVVVIHPSAREDRRFMSAIDELLPGSIEIEPEYLPPWVERKALELVGITGPDAEALMRRVQGLPCAYLVILTSRSRSERRRWTPEQFEQNVRETLDSLIRTVLERCSDEVQNLLYRMAFGLSVPSPLESRTSHAVRRTPFVRRLADGRLRMPPVVQEALRRSSTESK